MTDRINIFGGSGFIGSKFCELYEDFIIKNDRNDHSPKDNNILYFISTVDNYNVHNNLHVDIDTNLTVLMNVLEKIPKNSDVVFNFISSWFVYGQNHEIPFREDHSKCYPTGFYSITKYCAEQLLTSFCQTYGIKYRIFRLSNVLGEGDKKISRKKNALQFLIKEIVNNNDIHLYYGGEVLRDYLGVEDVCRAIKVCIDKSPPNQIINIGSGKPYRFLDLINKAIDYSKSSSKIIEIKPSTFHDIVQVRHSYLDTTKLASYGFVQKDSIDDLISRLVNYYQKEKLMKENF
jgi:nucleoside-diphosphate-sugar epimerase